MFEPGRVYRRADLHAHFGGQRQGGISTPRGVPLIFLFTGESGEQSGSHVGWEPDGTYRYVGEGQVGDMRFVAGNRAIRDHAIDGKDLQLFEILPRRGGVRFVGQMVCDSSELVPGVPDVNGRPRVAIAFRLVPLAAAIATDDIEAAEPSEASATAKHRELSALWSLPLEHVRLRAEATPADDATASQALRTTYRRSAAVRVYVLRRARGHCEGCGTEAPFLTPRGHPYLEPHHIRRLSDGGADALDQVIALCPTCHRRAHYAQDAQAFNAGLVTRLRTVVSKRG